MANLFERQPAGAGRNVNKKQMQDFIKEVLFEKSLANMSDQIQQDYDVMPGAAFAIIQTVSEAGKSGDFSKIKPLLDFAFDKDMRAKR